MTLEMRVKTPTEHTARSSNFLRRERLRAAKVRHGHRRDRGSPLTSKQKPRQGQNHKIGRHVERGIHIVKLGLVKAGAPLDRLVPVEAERAALEEQGNGEGGLRGGDPRS